MNDDVEILQEILDSEPAVKALGAPIDARKAAEAVRRLRSLAGTFLGVKFDCEPI